MRLLASASATGHRQAFPPRARQAVTQAQRRCRSTSWLAARLLLFAVVLGYAGYRGVTLIAAAPSLQIGHMVVRGHERLSTAKCWRSSTACAARTFSPASLDEWQQKLLSSPWVESATIRRVLPSTVEITVQERQPMGIGRHRHGDVPDRRQGRDRRRVRTGVRRYRSADHRRPGRVAAGRRFDRRCRARRVCRPRDRRRCRPVPRLPRRCRSSTCRICTMRSPSWTTTRCCCGWASRDFVARLQQYIDLAADAARAVAGMDYVDLRFDERLYVRPSGQAGGRRRQ